ncbi:sensor domain-containing diguanylate cyclase [Alkalicoccus chagannorensis]|uniref:sensor domain-containing diguanylate cyclase n=1 Tax=Alkalicoccus chagannorensis TaxID=427072 RepID=UPI0003FDEA3E|nr:sensor domain-containing diguanylate cyclase [Alkalicoccus chagannorensis]
MEVNVDRLPCGFLILDRDGRIMHLNQALADMLQMQAGEWQGMHIHDLLTRTSRIYYQTYFAPMVFVQKEVQELYLTLEKDGRGRVPVLANARMEGDRVHCTLLKMTVREEYERDILQAKHHAEEILEDTDEAYKQLQQVMTEYEQKRRELTALNENLHELSITDALTGLKNRRFLEEKIKQLLYSAENDEVPFSLILLDIDHFKKVNDHFGHAKGDEVLKALAQIFQRSSRGEDVAARMGGEEFMLLLPSTTGKEAALVAERICRDVEQHAWELTPITVSAGVTAYHVGDTAAGILSRVDDALYESKEAGRNRVSYSVL